jgi:VWFA-related protein
MGQRGRFVTLLFFLWFVGECCWGEPARFVISQVATDLPTVTVYLDVTDGTGSPPANLPVSELSAAIDGRPLTVSSVTPFEASGEGVAYIFLVDISKSIGPAQFTQMRSAMDAWIDDLKPVDRMAIFAFGEQYKQVADFTDDKAALKEALQSLNPTDMQTKLYVALSDAMNFSRTIAAGLPNRRVIVILSDGKDEGSGINAEDVRRSIEQAHVPIYAIGFSRLPAREKSQYLGVLARFAELSGGLYTADASLKTAYAEMQTAIRRLFLVQLECNGCRQGALGPILAMSLKPTGGVEQTNSIRVNVSLPAKVSAPPTPSEPWWKGLIKIVFSWEGLLGLVIVVGIGIAIFIVLPKPTPPAPPPALVLVPTDTVVPPPPVTPTPGRKVQLTVVAGKNRGQTRDINLSKVSVVGRDGGCDVSFSEDTEMSGKHFELRRADSYIEVKDLGSTNGTLLNGAQLLTSKRLEDGDLVRAGRTEIRINFSGET